jgi:Ulp1 family protease
MTFAHFHQNNGLNTVTNWYKINIFSYKKIFIPIYENHHWILVVIDTEVCRLVLYDSFSRSYNHILDKLRSIFENMYKTYYKTSINFF